MEQFGSKVKLHSWDFYGIFCEIILLIDSYMLIGGIASLDIQL